jgi:hypothetical protein
MRRKSSGGVPHHTIGREQKVAGPDEIETAESIRRSPRDAAAWA